MNKKLLDLNQNKILFIILMIAVHLIFYQLVFIKKNSANELPGMADSSQYHELARNLINTGSISAYYNPNDDGMNVYFRHQFDPNISPPSNYKLFPYTNWAPGFTVYLSVLYKIFGWNFQIARFCNILFYSLSYLIMAGVIYKYYHKMGLFFLLAINLFDPFYWSHSISISPEIAILPLISLLLVSLIEYFKGNFKYIILIGLSCGLLAFFRNVALTWSMIILGIIILYLVIHKLFFSRLKDIFLFLFILLAINGYWYYQNCKILDTFSPNGSQASVILYILFDDRLMDDQGNVKHLYLADEEFIQLSFDLFKKKFQNEPEKLYNPIEYEKFRMKMAKDKLAQDIQKPIFDLVSMTLKRMYNNWIFLDTFEETKYKVYYSLLLLISFLGLFTLKKELLFPVMIIFITFTISYGMTQSIFLRGILPFFPILHFLIASFAAKFYGILFKS